MLRCDRVEKNGLLVMTHMLTATVAFLVSAASGGTGAWIAALILADPLDILAVSLGCSAAGSAIAWVLWQSDVRQRRLGRTRA
jgi:hypothetical protein